MSHCAAGIYGGAVNMTSVVTAEGLMLYADPHFFGAEGLTSLFEFAYRPAAYYVLFITSFCTTTDLVHVTCEVDVNFVSSDS
ncbi:hypothetical protein ACJX0J_016623, partial [Zea mays]